MDNQEKIKVKRNKKKDKSKQKHDRNGKYTPKFIRVFEGKTYISMKDSK